MSNTYASLLFKYVIQWAEHNDQFEKCINRPLGLDSGMFGANWKINKLFWVIIFILQFFKYIWPFNNIYGLHYLNQIFKIRLENKIVTSKKLYQLAFNIGRLRGYHTFWKYIWIYTNMEDFVEIKGINNIIIPQNTYNKILANLNIK